MFVAQGMGNSSRDMKALIGSDDMQYASHFKCCCAGKNIEKLFGLVVKVADL